MREADDRPQPEGFLVPVQNVFGPLEPHGRKCFQVPEEISRSRPEVSHLFEEDLELLRYTERHFLVLILGERLVSMRGVSDDVVDEQLPPQRPGLLAPVRRAPVHVVLETRYPLRRQAYAAIARLAVANRVEIGVLEREHAQIVDT